MDVADDPIGIMGEGVDRFDREQRPLEGRHAVKSNAGGEELEHRIGAQLVPGAAQGQQAVEHAAPGGRPEHEENTMPSDCSQFGSAVLSRWCGPAQM